MVDIIILMDMSDSVGNLVQYYVSGLNTVIKTQQQLNPNCRLTLITFNHVFTVHFQHIQITSLAQLPMYHFKPNGSTALYDSLMGILELEKNNDNPIICITMTDGVDNVSSVKPDSLRRRIREKNWTFVFLGASNEANTCGYNLGIETCILYDATPTSIERASNAINVAISKVCTSFTGNENFLSIQDLELDVRDLIDGIDDMKID